MKNNLLHVAIPRECDMQQNEYIGATTHATVAQQIPVRALAELVLSATSNAT